MGRILIALTIIISSALCFKVKNSNRKHCKEGKDRKRSKRQTDSHNPPHSLFKAPSIHSDTAPPPYDFVQWRSQPQPQTKTTAYPLPGCCSQNAHSPTVDTQRTSPARRQRRDSPAGPRSRRGTRGRAWGGRGRASSSPTWPGCR